MKCIKTRAQVYLREYNQFALGDVFVTSEGTFILRTSKREFSPLATYVHFDFNKIQHAFDYVSGAGVSTYFASPDRVAVFGSNFAGIPVEEFN